MDDKDAIVPMGHTEKLLRDSLFLAYLKPGTTLLQVAHDHNVDYAELRRLADEDGWSSKKEQLTRELRLESDGAFDAFIAENRLPAAERLLSTTNRFLETIEGHLERNVSMQGKEAIMNLERLAKAMKNISDVQQRTVSISERSQSDVNVTVTGRGSFVGGVTPVKPTIDVEAREVD